MKINFVQRAISDELFPTVVLLLLHSYCQVSLKKEINLIELMCLGLKI